MPWRGLRPVSTLRRSALTAHTHNFIGTDASGTQDRGNDSSGILVNATDVRIGSIVRADRNLISGNNRHGIQVSGATATGNRILGNLIGTDSTGLLARGNSSDGIHLANAPGNELSIL